MDITVVKFDSSPEHYNAEKCIFWCFDGRFADLYNKFILDRNFKESQIDVVKGAGGAQPLAGGPGADRDVAESQIAKSIKLHHTLDLYFQAKERVKAENPSLCICPCFHIDYGLVDGKKKKKTYFLSRKEWERYIDSQG